MMKKQLSLLLFAFVLWTGCAHKQPEPSNRPSAGSMSHHDFQITTSKAEPAASDRVVKDDFDDDFFEDEFEEDKAQIADPFSPWNRAMFHFNDKLYFWILKPLARGYKAVAPEFFRTGIKNFFRNATTPIRMVNCFFQGKADSAMVEFSRFLANTIVGFLGFGSPADKYPELIVPDEEDFGQTLAVYGIGDGFYVVWPVFGPSTLRDSIGMVGDWFLNPVNYIDPTETSVGIKVFDKVNQTSFQIGEYESLKDAAIDPYVAIRNIYIQYREKKIKE